jgi:hypothetical protein
MQLDLLLVQLHLAPVRLILYGIQLQDYAILIVLLLETMAVLYKEL